MAALTLEAWRDRTLEQVHFAAQAALNAVVVQGHPRLRACVVARSCTPTLRIIPSDSPVDCHKV
jgi:hypothetical protein